MPEVLEFLHTTFNRSLANIQTIALADNYQVFSLNQTSLTPFLAEEGRE